MRVCRRLSRYVIITYYVDRNENSIFKVDSHGRNVLRRSLRHLSSHSDFQSNPPTAFKDASAVAMAHARDGEQGQLVPNSYVELFACLQHVSTRYAALVP